MMRRVIAAAAALAVTAGAACCAAAAWDPAVPERAEPVPEGYFQDAAFVGNSVVQGLSIYDYDGLLAGADFYAENSTTLFDLGSMIDRMGGRGYGKVYIGLGMNEVGYSDREVLMNCLDEGVRRLRELNPDVIVYIMSVTPISRARSQSDPSYTRELVLSFNDTLRGEAEELEAYYLDDFEVLRDEEGYLPSDVTADGVHFTPGHYEKWYGLMKTHYVMKNGETIPRGADKSNFPARNRHGITGRNDLMYERMIEQ